MIDPLLVTNLLSWGLQVLCLALVGAALPALLRLDAPGVRYAYWRTLLTLGLVLPFLQPRHAVTAVTSIAVSARLADGTAAATGEGPATAVATDWINVVLAALAVGALVRIAWIALGLLRLRRLRRAGREATDLGDQPELERLIGARAEVRYVPGIRQPVTFGVRPAVVLLPERVRDQSPDVQRAVLAHELFHVQRRDWVWLLLEELVRAVFWFHPAVWWLVSRIQLTREEVVDEMTLLVACRRSTYVQALLAFADTPPFTPVAAFARRRHLFRRIALISKEAAMSSKRLIASCAVMATVIAAGGWYAVVAFPLTQGVPRPATEAPGQGTGALEKQARPITPENPIPRRVSSTPAEYPPEAAALSISGPVTLRVTLDDVGRVAEARVIGLSLKNPDGFSVSFNNVSTADIESFLSRASAGQGQDPAAVTAAITALMRSAREAVLAWRYDSPAEAPLSFNVTINFGSEKRSAAGGSTVSHRSMPPPPPPPPPPPAPEFEKDALKVGGNIAPPAKIRDVKPVYPEEAKDARIQGVVILELRIDEEGAVSDARVLRSIPQLDQAALDTVRQWAFTPTLMNGKPIPVVMTVTVNFTLAKE